MRSTHRCRETLQIWCRKIPASRVRHHRARVERGGTQKGRCRLLLFYISGDRPRQRKARTTHFASHARRVSRACFIFTVSSKIHTRAKPQLTARQGVVLRGRVQRLRRTRLAYVARRAAPIAPRRRGACPARSHRDTFATCAPTELPTPLGRRRRPYASCRHGPRRPILPHQYGPRRVHKRRCDARE